MALAITRPHFFHFASLRRKLFAAFVGVLVLSLLLTAATFWVQIRLYDTQQVQSDLKNAAPTVFPSVKRDLERYWENWENTRMSPNDLKARLVTLANSFGVRILLTNYCNRVALDTSARTALVIPSKPAVSSSCSSVLDDMATAHDQPRTLNVVQSTDTLQQTTLPGAGDAFYLAYSTAFFHPYAVQRTGNNPLLVGMIIIAKSPGSVDTDAARQILPRLAVAGVAAVLLTLLVVWLIVRAITRPLHTITLASEKMAGGDYDQRVPEAGEDEVGQLARSFNRMASEVRDTREHQRQFIANVSHDLKTPLTSILGFSQILTDSEGVAADPMGRRAAQVINEEARRLQRLTLDLLDLSRLEAGQLQLRYSPVDLNDLVGRALTHYADLPANAALTFQDHREQGKLMVWGDADRLMQVLVNLLDNAVKFCDPAGSVAVHTARQNDTVLVTVANTGAGIAQEDLTRVFQRFYRTDHSRATRTGGTGLGLAIVGEIAGAHGGLVEARSEADGWTRFIVTLPVLRQTPEQAVHSLGARPVDPAVIAKQPN